MQRWLQTSNIPSAALGRNESIFISAGISGSKVAVLSNGLTIGQTVSSTDYVIPLNYLFKAGAFLSITSNIRNISPK